MELLCFFLWKYNIYDRAGSAIILFRFDNNTKSTKHESEARAVTRWLDGTVLIDNELGHSGEIPVGTRN